MTITIKGNTYDIDEGASSIKRYNETLDSANIRISHRLNPIAIEPFDKVILHTAIGDYTMCIDTYTEHMSCVNPVIYEYEISLFSETKKLEGIILPNLSITQLKVGTKLTIKDYLDRYLLLYGKKHRRNNGVWLDAWHFNVGNKFNVECPEFQWNTPTLREVFTDLMMVVDCIPVLNGNEISYIDLTEKKKNLKKDIITYKPVQGFPSIYENTEHITTSITDFDFEVEITLEEVIDYFGLLNEHDYVEIESISAADITNITYESSDNKLKFIINGHSRQRPASVTFNITYKVKSVFNPSWNINYIQKSQSSADYISEIKMNMQNVLQTDENLNTSVSIREVKPFESNDYIVNSENIIFKTRYPILRVKHLWFSFWVGGKNSDDEESWVYLRQDLCNLKANSETNSSNIVKEYKEWLTLNVFNRTTDIDLEKAETFASYRPLSVYYRRNGNTIENWNSDIKTFWLFTDSYLEILMKFICNEIGAPGITDIDDGSQYNNHYRPLLEIEYETMAGQVFQAGKKFEAGNDRVITDGQTNAWVDAFTQGLLEYQKANRLGNQLMSINARYEDNFDKVIKLGDYYDDSIIYQVQYQYYNDHIEINATGCKDYILKDYFTSIKAKVRTWVNAQDEAFERHELIKYYCEFSESRKNEYSSGLSGSTIEHFISPLLGYSGILNKTSIVTTNVLSPQTEEGYYAEQITRLIGNSIVYTTGFNDNAVLFNHNTLTWRNFVLTGTESAQNPFVEKPYTDDFGGIPIEPLKYVDDNFEFTNVSMILDWSKIPLENGYNLKYMTDILEMRELIVNQFDISQQKQSFSTGNPYIKLLNYPIYKDNREIPVFSVQFEFCSDTKDIVFTKKFLELQQSLANNALNIDDFQVFQGDLAYWDWKNPTLYGATSSSLYEFDVASYSTHKSTQISITGVDLNKCYYITDAQGHIILATKNITTFYLNILKDRDCNIYDADGNVIDNILN